MKPIEQLDKEIWYVDTKGKGLKTDSLFLENRYGAFYSSGYVERGNYGSFFNLSIDNIRAELLCLKWLTKRTARHEYFMSDKVGTEYTYGNKGMGDEKYYSEQFSLYVDTIRHRLNADLGTNFNGCFLNKYDDQFQHLGWHADDFAGMSHDEPIAVVSFGAEREIWVKKKEQTGAVPPEQRILLKEGSLFLMPIGYQDTHFHRIPKHDRPCGWRISLTFRSFL